MLAGKLNHRMLTGLLGEMNTSRMKSTVTKAPPSSALTGTRCRSVTFEIQREPGSAPSRAYENASREPAPWIEVPQQKKA